MSKKEMVLTRGTERKAYVKQMFNDIAHRYDFLNHFLSGGVDIYWRKKAVSKLEVQPGDVVLDLACGTGDFALETAASKGCRVVGTDIAQKMLTFGKQKLEKKRQAHKISYINGDGESLPFKTGSFKGVTIAFGIRNMGDISAALTEMRRILSKDGQAVILEFSLPVNPLFRKLYLFYFNHILPGIGRAVSSDSQAYSYLPASVEKFPAVSEFEGWMSEAGFSRVEHWKLLNGIAVIYRGIKKEESL